MVTNNNATPDTTAKIDNPSATAAPKKPKRKKSPPRKSAFWDVLKGKISIPWPGGSHLEINTFTFLVFAGLSLALLSIQDVRHAALCHINIAGGAYCATDEAEDFFGALSQNSVEPLRKHTERCKRCLYANRAKDRIDELKEYGPKEKRQLEDAEKIGDIQGLLSFLRLCKTCSEKDRSTATMLVQVLLRDPQSVQTANNRKLEISQAQFSQSPTLQQPLVLQQQTQTAPQPQAQQQLQNPQQAQIQPVVIAPQQVIPAAQVQRVIEEVVKRRKIENGVYQAQRGYRDSDRPSPNEMCKSVYSIDRVVVNDGSIRFDSDKYIWRGKIDQQTGIMQIEY
jgi:hypothetical protein